MTSEKIVDINSCIFRHNIWGKCISGESIGSAFMFAVALAVAAIPEALSSIVTIVLSLEHRRWQKNMQLYENCRR